MELLNATGYGNMELISKMISEGVDMNCFAGDEVCASYKHTISYNEYIAELKSGDKH